MFLNISVYIPNLYPRCVSSYSYWYQAAYTEEGCCARSPRKLYSRLGTRRVPHYYARFFMIIYLFTMHIVKILCSIL